ncbi:DUF6233 domain-containing protein [Streptomyces sp. NPDC058287]|uniref:DUF6233 domain-containing protein n=2 Tax=Streptomyces TaxID=1883 RepID=UPI0036EF011A
MLSPNVGGLGHAGGPPVRCRAVERDQALRGLTEGVPACTHCRPDTELGVLDSCPGPEILSQ